MRILSVFKGVNMFPQQSIERSETVKEYVNKNRVPVVAYWAQFRTKYVITWGTQTNRVIKTMSNHKTLPHLIKSLIEHHKITEIKTAQDVVEDMLTMK
ncbi:hypothetical protein ElyMa_003255200 [Elysia marginata]|uniref:Uncharacterized protein n=1 Tax=Elysia marginata TaxID=1093978 RepID=A0AAV4J6T1_9GAST|nr:hypothetical protein ElyMa_003255200 [Elysia marginata]